MHTGADAARSAAVRARAPVPRAAGAAALRFATGALIPFVTWLLLLPLLGAWGLYGGGTIARPIAVIGVACAAGGIVAGGAIGGARWRAAFCAAFCAAAWIPLLLLSGLPALGGRERVIELAVVFAPGFTLAYAVLGAIGLALGGAGWGRALRGVAVFGAAGGAGGSVIAGAAALVPGAAGSIGFAVQAVGGAAAFLLPAAIGGWWLARPRGFSQHARSGPLGP